MLDCTKKSEIRIQIVDFGGLCFLLSVLLSSGLFHVLKQFYLFIHFDSGKHQLNCFHWIIFGFPAIVYTMNASSEVRAGMNVCGIRVKCCKH